MLMRDGSQSGTNLLAGLSFGKPGASTHCLVAPRRVFVQMRKSPGGEPGLSRCMAIADRLGQETFENALVTLPLIGSAVSVAIFWARAVRSLVCEVIASTCLRTCAVVSSTISE